MRGAAAIGVVLLWAGLAQARGTCVVNGKKPPPIVVTVAPRDAAPFKLRVVGLPLSVATGGLAEAAHVTVRGGALAFTGDAEPADLPVRTRRAVDATNGMVRLAADTDKLTLHARVGTRWVDADVRLGPSIQLRGLTLPCDALTLDDDVPEPKPQLDPETGPRWIAAGKLLHFRGGPDKGPAMEVAVDDPAALELRRTEEHGDWMRVTTRWPDGTTIAGWVRKAELVAETVRHDRLGDDVPLAQAATCKQEATARENERISLAPVTVGAEVYAARLIGRWAKVIDGKPLKVRWRPKDDWVEIVGVPGLASVGDCMSSTVLLDAWLPRSAVKLPTEPVATTTPSGAAVKP